MRGGGVWVDDMNMGTSLLIEHAKIRYKYKWIQAWKFSTTGNDA